MHRTSQEYQKETREQMKGGVGTVLFEHIWKKNSNEEMRSNCRQFSRLTLNPGCSAGRHFHEGEEEIYYILSGKARSFDNGEWVELGPGDATICRSGEEHSMECLGDEPCTYLAVVITYPAPPGNKMPRKVLLRRFLMGLIAFALVLGGFCFFREVTSKQDAVNTMHNLRKVHNALEEYQKEHGHYPPQQDMHSLMQMLKISGKDLFKTSFIDIRTARYTAPQKNSKEPILQLHVPRRWYDSRSQSFIIREIGTVENQPGSSMPGADKLR